MDFDVANTFQDATSFLARARTPTGPFFARCFIVIILGLVAEFAFMGPSTRLVMSFFAARWMGRKQIVGWKFQHDVRPDDIP